MAQAIQRKWKQNIDQCLRYCLKEFLKNPQYQDIHHDMVSLLDENKVIEAYAHCTNTSESFRIKSKASLFLELRELLEPISPKFEEKRWNKQLFNICSWFDINKSPHDILAYLYENISSDIQTTQPNTLTQYALHSKSFMVKGVALHSKYAVPIAGCILKYLTNNYEMFQVWEPGRLIHPTLYFMACTPDVIISHSKKDFYRMMDSVHAQKLPSGEELANNAVQAILELKTFHKAHLSKSDMNAILEMSELQYYKAKESIVKIITDLAVKQKILPTSETREVDYIQRSHSKSLRGFSKTFILYPTDDFIKLNMKSIPTNQLGFIPSTYTKYSWPMENLCSENTLGRAWVLLYDPCDGENTEPQHVFSYEKSPFVLLPKSKVFRQMLEQRCVVQYYNSDAVSLFVGMFCVGEDGETNTQGPYGNSKVSPGLVLVIETKLHAETTRAFEECSLMKLNEKYPQALGATSPLPPQDVTDIINSLVWTTQLEEKTSFGLGNYNPKTDLSEQVLKDSFF